MSEVAWAGRFLEARIDGTWEYTARKGAIGAAVILAVEGGHVLLVEQYRVPLGRNCIELPAGLVGDEADGEAAEAAAARELEEETGYRARHMEDIGVFASSPGMTSETFHLMRATGLEKVHDGGGVDGENIIVHRVALADIARFLATKRQQGCAMDMKLLPLLGLL